MILLLMDGLVQKKGDKTKDIYFSIKKEIFEVLISSLSYKVKFLSFSFINLSYNDFI